ncbi:MAG: hypothetical protein ACREBR_04680 [bacterium]
MSEDLVKNLKKLCELHDNELHALRLKIQDIEVTPVAKALVGRCFKWNRGYGMFSYTNSMVYKRIKAINGLAVIVDTVQLDKKYDKIELSFNQQESAMNFVSRSVTEVSRREYDKIFVKVLRSIVKLSK